MVFSHFLDVFPVFLYRDILYSVQNIVKKDPGRAEQSSLATAGKNFTNLERIIK